MASEEYELLRNTVREFAEKNIENIALKIEREGLDADTLGKMATQGFLGAMIPAEHGGAGLDQAAYLLILEELAKSSPSAAARVLITNSLFAPLLVKSGKSPESLRKAATGELNVSVAFSNILEGFKSGEKATLNNSAVKGRREYVLNSNADEIITALDDEKNTLVLLKGGFNPDGEHQQLGFRGLKYSGISIDSSDFEVLSENGNRELDEVLNSLDLEIASVALGIASGALNKAIEYSKVRSTFQYLLKDYQPVAFALSSLKSDEEMLRSFIYRPDLTDREKVMARIKAVDLVKRATKQALQTHGGYGYLEDFGVEKFYRDSMALSVMFARNIRDMQRLSELIYESKSGYL